MDIQEHSPGPIQDSFQTGARAGLQKIAVTRFTTQLTGEWNNFVTNEALNSSMLHSRDFYNHNEANSSDDESLLFYKKNTLVAVLPAVLLEEEGELVLSSHARATYGGLLVRRGAGMITVLEIVQEMISYARQKQATKILICLPFRIFKKEFCDEIDYAFWYHGFRTRDRKLEIAVPLYDPLNQLKGYYHRDTVRGIKKGIQHLIIERSEEFNVFWPILEKRLEERHGRKPVHSLESIEKLRQSVGNENVLLFTANHEAQVVAGIVVFILNHSVLHAQYIAHDSEFQHLRPVNVIIDYLIEWGHMRNFKYLNLGTGNEHDGRINAGLFRFKESFGGRGVLRETISLKL